MKKIILFSLLLSCGFVSKAQTLTFCKKVDTEGKLIGTDTAFILEKGTEIIFYVSCHRKLNTTKLKYKIYKVDDRKNEKYDNTIEQAIQTDWSYAWKGIIFNNPGTYKINVYTEAGVLVTSGKVTIIF